MAKTTKQKTGKRKGRILAIGGAHQVRRKTFDGLPIVDAESDMLLVVSTKDVEAAKGQEKDAANCILAKACRDKVGATVVAFFRGVAYMDLPDAKGTRRVVRFMLSDEAAAIVSAFDKGKHVKGEVTVKLLAPTAGMTLDSIRERRQRNKEAKNKALIRGEIFGGDSKQARFHRRPRISDMDVRNGSGRVHNSLKA